MKPTRIGLASYSDRSHGGRRGAMLVLIVLLLPVLLFLLAMSVDVGYVQLVRTELRSATDAAARAAGESLSREQDTGAARGAAKALASANRVAGQPLLLDDGDIVFGRSTQHRDGSWQFTANATPINSVRVNARRTSDSPSGSVPLFFGRLIGVSDFEPTQAASAVRLDRDICLVVDQSSSMKLSLNTTQENMSTSDPRFSRPPIMGDSRWGALDKAIDVFIAALAETPYTEQVGLVSYASDGTWSGVHNNASDIDQRLTTDPARVTSALDAISSRVFNGMTNISAGIDSGVVVLTDSARARPYAAKTMVLLTDGIWNQGRDPVLAAQDADAKGIVIHTITFGDAARHWSMQAVADRTSGKHYHAPDAETLKKSFREIALSLPVILTE